MFLLAAIATLGGAIAITLCAHASGIASGE